MAGLNTVGRKSQVSHASHAATRKGRRDRTGRPAVHTAAASGFERLESRLLMSAVRPDAAFGLTNLGIGDDRSFPTSGTPGVSLGFSSAINFFGMPYNGVFVNNNGNISLGARNTFYSNANLDSLPAKVIAPFYANVDTRFAGSSVRYGRGTVDGHAAFGVNWLNVDYYPSNVAHSNRNSFQLVLIDRTDLGAGNFDMEFNYDQIRWESGLNSGGDANGLGGSTARIGWTANNGTRDAIHQMAGSNVAGSFLDGNLISGLVHNSFMSDVDGRYVFRFRGGTWADAPTGVPVNHEPVVTAPADVVLVEDAYGSAYLGGQMGFFDDVDADTWTATVDYGDGWGPESLSLSGRSFVLGHTYRTAGAYTVTVKVDDGKGGVGVDTMNVVVEDHSAPVVDVLVPDVVRENESATLSISLANDPDANEAYTYQWTGSGVAEGAFFHFLADDNGLFTVSLRVTDPSGNSTVVDVPVTVHNVAPTATGLSGADTVAPGETLTVTLDGVTDRSPVDVAAGLLLSVDFDGDGAFDLTGPVAPASYVYASSGVYLVRARVWDKDGGYSDYEKSVTVHNAAPVSSGLTHSGDVNEGNTVTVSFGPVTDEAADLAAGLTYAFDLDGDGLFEVSGSSPVVSHLFDDSGSHVVRGRVSDRRGAYSDYETTVNVGNVAPTSTGLAAPAEGDEGAALAFSLGAGSDVSTADSAAGFTYSFDFDGDGVFEVSGSSLAASHVFDDNGTYTVRARVTDKDGGSNEYSAEVTVNNVAPRNGRLSDNNPIAEGSLVTVSFEGQDDPSAADTAAGFTYSFDFDGDGVFEVSGTSPLATYGFADNGVYVVTGRVTDKDGGYTDYTTDVEVYNVAPTALSLFSSGTHVEGNGITVRLDGASDPSSTDTAAGLTYSFDVNDDGVFDVVGAASYTTQLMKQDGVYTVRARVADKDGGFTDYVASVTVANAAPVVTTISNSGSTLGRREVGDSVTVMASFTDAGVLDRHTAVIDWGDGTTSNVLAASYNGKGGAFGTHRYSQGGIYAVTLNVRDDASPAGVAVSTTQVFVTGVGLRNGVLHIVGTNGSDRVDVSRDNRGRLRVKTDFGDNASFNGASVREIRATLGSGRDRFEADSDVTQPIYVNGVRYVPPRRGNDRGGRRFGGITHSIFSDRLVA